MDGPRDEAAPPLERALTILRDDRAPASLRVRVALIGATVRRPRSRPRPRPAAAVRARGLALAATVTALAAALATLGAGATPSVAEVVALSVRPAVAGVREPQHGRLTLPGITTAGLSFPYWEDRFGWRATGFRRDRLDGRTLTTVLYARGRQRVAYTIISARAVPSLTGARAILQAGIHLHASSLGDRQVVTWVRRGHTCVLSGVGVPAAELAAIGSWRGGGAIAY